MARKRLPIGEKKVPVNILIEGKYLENKNLDELKEVAYKAIVKFSLKIEKNSE